MASLQDFSLITSEIAYLKKRYRINEFSRAFIYAVLEKLYEIDIDEIENYVIDGAYDFGIDAYYWEDARADGRKTINIFQFKHTEKFENAQKADAFRERDVNDIIVKLERIWHKDGSLLKSPNRRFTQLVQEMWDAFNKGVIQTKVWLISNYINSISDKNKIKHFEVTVREKFKADLEVWSLDELVSLFIKKDFRPVDLNLQLSGRRYFDTTTGQVRAVVGVINAHELIKKVINENDELREEIFNENIRVYLTRNTKVNSQIYRTIEAERENANFFFYNNGITVICDSLVHANTDSPVVALKNFQIVNGGQTIHALYEAYKNNLSENIKNIDLLLRIYEVKNRDIGQAIARYTNTQNPVRSRDIMSNDPVQIKKNRCREGGASNTSFLSGEARKR